MCGPDAGPAPESMVAGYSVIADFLKATGQVDYDREIAKIKAELKEHMGSWSADESERFHRDQSVIAAHTWDCETEQPRCGMHACASSACPHMPACNMPEHACLDIIA